MNKRKENESETANPASFTGGPVTAYRLFRGAISKIDRVMGTEWHIRLHNRLLGFHSNRYEFPENVIAFIHIPKSAGTTLHFLLQERSAVPIANLGMHRPVSKRCPPSRYRYITFMRDPVDRVWSYYQMALRREGSLYSIFADRGLDYFIQSCWETRNAACRYIAGEPFREPNAALLQRAWQNLKQFYFVGRFEHLETDILRLFALLGDSNEQINVLHLRKRTHLAITPKEREIVASYNSLDVELYERFQGWARSGSAMG